MPRDILFPTHLDALVVAPGTTSPVADLERKFATIIDDGLPAGMRFDLGLDPSPPARDPAKPPPVPRRRPSKETLR